VAVEAALVLLPLATLTFAVFEYGRFLMHMNVLNNAVRESCRYAIVNNTVSTVSSDSEGVLHSFLGNEIGNFSNLTVSVTGTHDGATTAINDLVAGDMLTVTVTARYGFLNIIPLVPMPSITIKRAVTMTCEGAS